MIVSCREVRKKYREREVLRGVTLSVYPGEIYCLLGPNGAGKTTLMNIVCGQVRATAGSVTVLGCDPIVQRHLMLRRLGIVASNARGLWWRLTGLENLLRSAALYHIPAQVARGRALELLERFEIASHLNKPVGLYSTGMKVRLSLARALLHDPELLVLDEPWSGLDPQGKLDLAELLRSLASGNRAVLVTSHELPQVEEIADRVGILLAGRMVIEDTLKNLVNKLPFSYIVRVHDTAEKQEYKHQSMDEAIAQLSLSLASGAAEVEVRKARIEDVYFSIDQKGTPLFMGEREDSADVR